MKMEVLRINFPVRMSIVKAFLKGFIKPGLNHFYMHTSTSVSSDGQTIPQVFPHKPGEDLIVRLGDTAVWSSDEMKTFLKEQKIEVVNYTQLKKIQEYRNNDQLTEPILSCNL